MLDLGAKGIILLVVYLLKYDILMIIMDVELIIMKKRSSKFRYVAIIILLLFLIVGLYGNYMDFYIDAGFDVSDARINSILYTALSSVINFAIVSVIPLIIKIRNRAYQFATYILSLDTIK